MAKIIPLKNGTKKESIAKNAAALFKEKGFTGTSMKAVADAVGVEAPSLYNHISSKKEILQEICFKIANLFTNYIMQLELSRQPVIKKLELIIRFHIRMMLDEYQSVYVSEHEWKHLPEPYLTNFKNLRKSYQARLAAIVEQGVTSGELHKIHPPVAVLAILSAIHGIDYWHRSRKLIDAESLEENLVKMLLNGISNNS